MFRYAYLAKEDDVQRIHHELADYLDANREAYTKFAKGQKYSKDRLEQDPYIQRIYAICNEQQGNYPDAIRHARSCRELQTNARQSFQLGESDIYELNEILVTSLLKTTVGSGTNAEIEQLLADVIPHSK